MLASAAVVALGAGTVAFGLTPASAVDDDFGPGPCEGSRCPGTFPPPGSDVDEGYRDEAVNVYAGQGISISGAAAEMEGRVVTPGGFRLDKDPAGIFNVGLAGVGSRVSPPEGSDYLTVGGNLDVEASNTLAADGGVIRIAGSQTGGGTARDRVVVDTGAVDDYANADDVLTNRSTCLATLAANGTVEVTDSTVTFNGDGESDLQIFETDASLQSPGGGSVGFAFAGIPADATVLINLTGDDVSVNTYSGDLSDQDPWNQIRDRLLWNVPNADSFAMHGPAQFQGSLLAGAPSNTTTLATAGFNGRLFTAGTLVQTSDDSGGQGGEIHNYPFTGVLPTCEEPPTDPPTTSEPPTDPPTTSEPPTDPPTTSEPPTDPPTTSEPPTDPPTTSEPPTDPPTTSEPPTDPPTTSEPPTDPSTTTEPPTGPPTSSEAPVPPTTAGPPSNPPSDPPTAGPPSPTSPGGPGDDLPVSGSNVAPTLAISAGLLALGIVIIVSARITSRPS